MKTVTRTVTTEIFDKFVLTAFIAGIGYEHFLGIEEYSVDFRTECGKSFTMPVSKAFLEEAGCIGGKDLKKVQMEIKFVD